MSYNVRSAVYQTACPSSPKSQGLALITVCLSRLWSNAEPDLDSSECVNELEYLLNFGSMFMYRCLNE